MYLRPTAEIAPDALLPGDPGRALTLAQELLDRPRMSNHHRGLWGYTGTTSGGVRLTIQATGIGGPSAAIVLADLARHGVRRAIRLGTCTALAGGPALGSLLTVPCAVAIEGSSRSLGASGTVAPDRELDRRMLNAAAGAVSPTVVASVDVLHPASRLEPRDWRSDGVRALEMGTATLFALGATIDVAVASGLVVGRSDRDDELDDESLERASVELGALAARALG